VKFFSLPNKFSTQLTPRDNKLDRWATSTLKTTLKSKPNKYMSRPKRIYTKTAIKNILVAKRTAHYITLILLQIQKLLVKHG